MRATVLRPVLALQQGAVERNARFEDPERLRAERDSLAAFLVGQATLSAENDRLRELLGLHEKLAPSFVPAEVVQLPGRGAEGFFQLTAGANQGVRPGSPIVAATGLVGRVRDVDDNISFGIDWMNPEFRASAMTVDGTVYGIVEPRRGPGGEPMLALTGTPRHAQLEQGTMIVTSGHGGVFPRGVPIGTVDGVEGQGASWQRNYLVRPLVGPSQMTYVLVLGDPAPGLSGQDLAQVWGIRPPETTPADTAAAAAALIGGDLPPASGDGGPAQQAPGAGTGGGTQGGPRLLGVPVQRPAAGDTAGGNGAGG